eukprot:6179040-Pleurochrysis_carterae.AAC.4
MRQTKSGLTGPLPSPMSTCRAMRRGRSLTSSEPSRLKRVRARRLPSLDTADNTPRHSRPLKPTSFSPACLLIVAAWRKPNATAGTLFASDLPLGCSSQAACATSFKASAGGSRPSPSPSTAGSKRPSMSDGSQPHMPRTLIPLHLSMLPWDLMRTFTNLLARHWRLPPPRRRWHRSRCRR